MTQIKRNGPPPQGAASKNITTDDNSTRCIRCGRVVRSRLSVLRCCGPVCFRMVSR